METKSLKLVIVAFISFLFLMPSSSLAHGKPPKWAPAHGYRAKTRHIYFPQYNLYYDFQRSAYFYLNNGKWSISVKLPAPYIGINLGAATQIQLNYIGATPYFHNTDHCRKYKVAHIQEPRVIIIEQNRLKHHDHQYEKKQGHKKRKH